MNPLLMSLIGSGVNVGAGLLGRLFSDDDRRRSENILNQGLDEYGQLSVPELERLRAEELGPSAFENVRADPRSIEAQRSVFDRLEQMSREGLTFEDMMAQEKALRTSARNTEAGRQRIAQDMAARGTLDSGAQLAMQLQNQQQGAEGDRDIAMQTAANAQKRMYEAMMNKGQLAGDMRNQSFNEQSQIAQARDAVQRYNSGARQNAAAGNIQNQQWQYGQRANLAGNRLNASQARAGMYQNRAQDTQNLFGAIGGAGNQAAQLGGDYLRSQQGGTSGYRLGQGQEDEYSRGMLVGGARGRY